MSERRIDVFFYGLFMDTATLLDIGVEPDRPRPAFVDAFELRIGQRATLVPTIGARAYGMLFALTHDELQRLYSRPGLEQYCPEALIAQSLDGKSAPALCYNLRSAPGPEERNVEYASRLQGTLQRLGFPSEYAASIHKRGA